MGESESGVVGAIAVAAVLQLLFSLGLFAWGRWVARRHGGRGWRRAAWMPLVAVALAIAGMIVSTVALVRAFGAVASVEAADRARVLAENISEAMNVTALFAVPSTLLYGASIVAFSIGSLLRPREPQQTQTASPHRS